MKSRKFPFFMREGLRKISNEAENMAKKTCEI